MEKDIISYIETFTNVFKSRDRPFGDTEVYYHEFRDVEVRVCFLDGSLVMAGTRSRRFAFSIE